MLPMWLKQAHNVAPSAFNIMMQMINDHLSALHSVRRDTLFFLERRRV
jgi:hypothetical protein